MEQNEFRCTGDCMKCHPNQRQYCAAQISYNTMRMVGEIKAKLDAIQGNEAMLFNPDDVATTSHQTEQELAQSGEGAESRSPKQYKN